MTAFLIQNTIFKGAMIMKDVKKTLNRIKVSATCAAITVSCTAFNVLAKDKDPTEDPTKEINDKIATAKNLIYGIVGAVGGIVVAINLLKALKGYKNGDDRAVDQGVTGVVVGILMSAFGTVMAIFKL